MRPHEQSMINLIGERIGGHLTPMRGAEIGVLTGGLSAALLEAFGGLTLYMADRWAAVAGGHRYAQSEVRAAAASDELRKQQMHAAIEATAFAQGRRMLLVGESDQVASCVPDASLDWVFIDGDHTREGVSADLAAWAHKVKAGGLVCGHDIDVPRRPGWGVRAAVEQWLEQRGRTRMELSVLGGRVWHVSARGGRP